MSKSKNVTEFKNLKEDIEKYIEYTKILESEYKFKHEELKSLVDYTYQILNTKSISEGKFSKIKKELQKYPSAKRTEDLIEELNEMIKQQKIWESSNKNQFESIKRRISGFSNKSKGQMGLKNNYRKKKSKKNMNNVNNQNINNKLISDIKVKLVKKKRFRKSQKNIRVSRKNRNNRNNRNNEEIV